MYKDFEQLPLVLSVPEVARVLNLGRDTTYGLVRSGRIRSVRVGRQYRVPKAAGLPVVADEPLSPAEEEEARRQMLRAVDSH